MIIVLIITIVGGEAMLKVRINSGKTYNNIQKYIIDGVPDYVIDLVETLPEACSKDYQEFMTNSHKIPGLTLDTAHGKLIVTSKTGIQMPGKVSLFDADKEPTIQEIIEADTREWADLTFDRNWIEMTIAETLIDVYTKMRYGDIDALSNYEQCLNVFASAFGYSYKEFKTYIEQFLTKKIDSYELSRVFEQFSTEEIANALLYSYKFHGRSVV